MDNRSQKYLVNGTLLAMGIVYMVLLMAVGITCFFISRHASGVIFCLVGASFSYFIWQYGSVVDIDEEGLHLSFMGFERRRIAWCEVAEIDVAGERVLNRGKRKKCGTVYFIVSKEALTEEQRFDMLFRWPPRNKIFFLFSKERLYRIQFFYDKPVIKYNIGKLDI